MSANLIHTLNANIGKTPDQIVRVIGDPFGQWRHCGSLTRDEFDANRETRIVICAERRRSRVNEDEVELHHKIGALEEGYDYHQWNWEDWNSGTLSSRHNWWFRSFASFEANPTEGF